MAEVMKIKCPRCGCLLTAYQGEPDVECTWCTRFCEDGSQPSDCTLVDHTSATYDAWRGLYNWPQGMHSNRSKVQEDTAGRVKYCTTHGKFVTKIPFLVKVPWSKYKRRRLPKHLRFDRHV